MKTLSADMLCLRADRKKVLKHHPDKKAGSGDANDDAFFKCIQKGASFLSLHSPHPLR
jgi:hypothetical protein